MEEPGLPCVVSMESPGFPKEADMAPTFLVPCSYGAVRPPLYFTTLHLLYMESLHVPYQVSVWKKTPSNPNHHPTRSHKHDLFLSYNNIICCQRISLTNLDVQQKKSPHTRQAVKFYILKAPMNYVHSNQVCPHKSHSATLKLIIKRSILKISIMMSIKDWSKKTM